MLFLRPPYIPEPEQLYKEEAVYSENDVSNQYILTLPVELLLLCKPASVLDNHMQDLLNRKSKHILLKGKNILNHNHIKIINFYTINIPFPPSFRLT